MKSNRAVAIAAMLFRLFLLLSLAAASARAGEIHDAAAAGDLNKVRALLAADPTLLESKDNDGNTPLISACFAPPSFNPQVAVANYLIDQGANIKAQNNWSGTPLYCALRSPDLIQRLIDQGADVNARAFGANGLTPLQQAAAIGELKTARFLIEHGADINGRSLDGTILQHAIKKKGDAACDMARLLLESGAKLQEYSFGNTELHLAALKDAPDIARLLVEHGADVNARNDYGHTPLYYAARHRRRRAAEALLAAGADKSTVDETNYGDAPQLAQTLETGEAYLWFLGGNAPGTGYAVKTKQHLLVFDPQRIEASPESGLANGFLNPNELAGQRITFLFTRTDRNMANAAELARRSPGANFVLRAKPTESVGDAIPPHRVAVPRESMSLGDIRVQTIRSTGRHTIGGWDVGLGYLVEADGVKVFHAGMHGARNNSAEQLAQYRNEIDFLKSFGPVDFVILPVNGRHLGSFDYEPYLYLIDQLSPKAIYLIGDDFVYKEHRKCLEVLKARNVPVYYPEGGIAVGERFHFVRERASAVIASATKSSQASTQ